MSGKDQRARFLDLLGPESTNFCGSGLSMDEFVRLGMAEKFTASWSNQDRDERRHRLDVVIRLAVELTKIRESMNFATRLAEMAIESVIEGDWKMVEELAEHFAFDEGDSEAAARDMYATFREILSQAIRAREVLPS